MSKREVGKGKGNGFGSGTGRGAGNGSGGGTGDASGSGRGRHQRFIQPTILMVLLDGPSHGYDLASRIVEYGFIQAEAPPGMIYKHLRQMEEDGLLVSGWDAEGAGPAKRNYSITEEGREALTAWVAFMDRQAEKLSSFVAAFKAKGVLTVAT